VSAGLFGLLDDVAALARLAAASVDDVGAAAGRATMKSAGVVVDDTAVTPQYVHGVAAERELPIVKKIAKGSIRNKLLIILPAALLLSQFLPAALPIILMLGGTYLAYEGAEKIWAKLAHHDEHEVPVTTISEDAERDMVAGAVRTDLILSAEIMVIALNEVKDESFLSRLAILFVVAIAITIAVYGVVALIVKMDDMGLLLTQRRSKGAQRVGHALVAGMPKLLTVISVVGTAAMLWVGGHILLSQSYELGWHPPYDLVHDLEHGIHEAVHGFLGSLLAWLANTGISALVGLAVGALVVLVMHFLPFGHGKAAAEPGEVHPTHTHADNPTEAGPHEHKE
jgi:predicted DNA repair protein MutK